ncbi:hypothetical protein K6L59_02705 [Candidatus Phytoplasma sp. Tabriz.2]|nr:hypothetical protein [Candidatus Phytoplasma australiense]
MKKKKEEYQLIPIYIYIYIYILMITAQEKLFKWLLLLMVNTIHIHMI